MQTGNKCGVVHTSLSSRSFLTLAADDWKPRFQNKLCCSHVTGILAACNDKSGGSSNLKIEALGFLTTALDANDPSVFQPYVAPLSSGVFNAVNERYYKVCMG